MPTEEFEPFDNKPEKKRSEDITINFVDMQKLYHAKLNELSTGSVRQLQAAALFNGVFVDNILNYIHDNNPELYYKTLDFTLTFVMQELKINTVTIKLHDGTLKTYTNVPDPQILSNIKGIEDLF